MYDSAAAAHQEYTEKYEKQPSLMLLCLVTTGQVKDVDAADTEFRQLHLSFITLITHTHTHTCVSEFQEDSIR